MKGKKRLTKLISIIFVIGIIIAIVKDALPINVIRSAQRVDKQATLGANASDGKVITGWHQRVLSYGTKLGRRLGNKDEEKWLFFDSKNVYNNLYCIQSGKSHSDEYTAHDLYNIDEATRKQYFGEDESNYHHFLWILENMYLISMANEDEKTAMEDELFGMLHDENGELRAAYNGMVEELNGIYSQMAGYRLSVDGNNAVYSPVWDSGIGEPEDRVAKDDTGANISYTIDERDNFMKMIQNYFLLAYTKQKGGNFGLSIVDNNGKLKDVFEYYTDTKGWKSLNATTAPNSVMFTSALLKHLETQFNNEEYDINKYKNFNETTRAQTGINSMLAAFDNNEMKIGPFSLFNQYGFTVTGELKYGDTVITAYQLLDENDEVIGSVDANGKFNISDKTNGKAFFIKINDETGIINNADVALSFNWKVDFGEIPTLTLFVPTGNDSNAPQVVIDVERAKDSKQGNWTQTVDARADIALKKYIVKVNENDVQDRLTSITLNRLIDDDPATPHDAVYLMNKTPYAVKVGDAVTYAIHLFNEGEIDGTASKVTDHLPNYLTFKNAYYYDGENKTNLAYEKVGTADYEITNPQAVMPAYDGSLDVDKFKNNSQIIYVECEVQAPQDEQTIYTNIAEITEYKLVRGTDIDSKPTNWQEATELVDRSSDEWINYSGKDSEANWTSDNVAHPFSGYEDDDDFDKIKVEMMDLALTKRFTRKVTLNDQHEIVSGENLVSKNSSNEDVQKDKCVISDYANVKKGKKTDLTYTMNKKEALVQRGDKLETILTVYNEGTVDATVKYVTDYLPDGLDLDLEATQKANTAAGVELAFTPNAATSDMPKRVVIQINGATGKTLENIVDAGIDTVDSIEIKLILTVSNSANGRLYNSAAITEYGFVDNASQYRSANTKGIDIDSISVTDGRKLRMSHQSFDLAMDLVHIDRTDIGRPANYEEDDDDYDCVEVENYTPIFDLSLRKYIAGVTKKYDENGSAKVEVPDFRVPELTVAGVTKRLGDYTTADYYHEKIKVFVEKGDLVTYKIRVYNEGINNSTRKDFRGRATQITDYLPDGLEFVKIDDSYDSANGGEWELASSENSKVVINYVGDKILPTNALENIIDANMSNTDDSEYYQEVSVICRVTADAADIDSVDGIKILTNRAAITGHDIYAAETDDVVTEYDGVTVTDRDSQPEEIAASDLNLDGWYRSKVIDESSNPQAYYEGVQDDDDFETVFIKGYTVELNKVDENDNNITGAEFNVSKWRDPSRDTSVQDISSAFAGINTAGTATYVANGATTAVEKDYYIIKETSAPQGHYNPFDGKYVKFYVSLTDKGYVANDMKIYNEADDSEIDSSSEIYRYVQLVNDAYTSKVTLTFKNPVIEGGFKLNLVKTIKGEQDPDDASKQKPLAGAKFNIKIENGNSEIVYQTEQPVETDAQGKIPEITGISIADEGIEYTITVTETFVPEGYIGLGEPVTFKAKSVAVNGVYKLDVDYNTQISNDYVKPTIRANEIYIEVENRPEPVIHKGVKTVENQDSGYDVDKPQTWVITTTVPAGINDYTRYIVTDVIDSEKTNAADKRIEFINEDNPAGNVTVEYINDAVDGEEPTTTDVPSDLYKVDFDKIVKQLKVTFINATTDDGNFVGGRNLTEGKTIKITYKTKFRVDEDGNIIGINQDIHNQAEITFNANGNEEKIKKSENPEVHTGGFGIFKYDVNTRRALQGAHFKITRDRAEAEKAVRAILAGDEVTLNTVDFVKVKDANGNDTSTDVEIVTGADGRGRVEGLEFGEDALEKAQLTQYVPQNDDEPQDSYVYQYDWEKVETTYYVVETISPDGYLLLGEPKEVVVKYGNYTELDLTKYYEVPNNGKEYDLALRKFIIYVEGEGVDRPVTNRVPQVTLSDEFKDPNNYDVTTASYKHTKDPVTVKQGDVVTYTIRVYNEGIEDAYAALIKDEMPAGTEFIPYTVGDGSVNDIYRWKMYDANMNKTSDVKNAKYITSDYLSMENGKDANSDGINDNLLKGFDSATMTELDYRDLKVQLKVTEDNKSTEVLTNYAQISKMTNSDGNRVEDRDSHQDEWIPGEDDQDVEHLVLTYFDLALRKWVTKAIVTQDGKETIFETGHKAEDNPEDVVKVDLKKSKLDKVVVKFEYQIRITNEGKLGGWCDEIKDHIPDGLTFDQEDNPTWTVVDDKTVTTDALKGTFLNHGESAEVTIVLRWINSGSNLGVMYNDAEISKDRNEYGLHDYDSTPDNYKWGEDDIDNAPVMLAIKTGNEVIQAVTLAVIVVSILALGVRAIKKI